MLHVLWYLCRFSLLSLLRTLCVCIFPHIFWLHHLWSWHEMHHIKKQLFLFIFIECILWFLQSVLLCAVFVPFSQLCCVYTRVHAGLQRAEKRYGKKCILKLVKNRNSWANRISFKATIKLNAIYGCWYKTKTERKLICLTFEEFFWQTVRKRHTLLWLVTCEKPGR